MRFGHVSVEPGMDDSLWERVTLLPLQEKDASVHAHGAPFDRLGDLSLSQLHLFTIPHEVDEVQWVVKVDLVLHGAANLTLHLLVTVCLLVFVVDVVDSDFIILTPQLRDC